MHDKPHLSSSHFIPGTNRVHRVGESCQIIGVGKSLYYQMRKEGLIEPPIKIGRRARGHTTEYLASLIKRMGE